MENGNGRVLEWAWHIQAIWRHLPGGAEKNNENVSQNIRLLGRDLDPGFHEYEVKQEAPCVLNSRCKPALDGSAYGSTTGTGRPVERYMRTEVQNKDMQVQ
jgi:hypothetical protein